MRAKILMMWLLTAGMLAGCGGASGDGVPTSAVSGKLTVSGAPLTDALVSFTSAERGTGSSATVDAEGRYTLPDKLPIGTYDVTVMRAPLPAPIDPNEPPPPVPPSKVPAKYGSPAGGLKAEVTEGNSTFDFDLTP